ncbi:MAG: hypothetical protein D6731_15555 [Planctomycetota bacterium]|nr:MAG: hypothetical protein D6731_15555 [Planctomycetota bacterium]
MAQRLCAFLALALILGGWPARAQQPERPAPDRNSERVLTERLYEAYNKGDWGEVVDAFKELRNNFTGTLENKKLVFLNAQALFNLKKYKAASSALETLLALQDDHIGALYLLAKIYALSKKPQDLERAKDLLIQAARAGAYVLRDINSKDGQKYFKKMLKDSTFILRVMNASNEFTVSSGNLRNPFRSPLKEVEAGATEVEPVAGPNLNRQLELEQLEQRIEALFGEIERLAQDRQVEELIVKFTELRQIMNEYGQEGSELVKKKQEKWAARLAAFGEVQLSIQLQIYINEGNQHLRAMAEAIRNEDYDGALERFERIKELKEQMYNEEREVFHRNAEALFVRGKALRDTAARLKKISEFKLVVTGIVVTDPSSDDRDAAIINDRIYEEGDAIMDEETQEEIEGLTVVEISKSVVRFRYEDTEFVRQLRENP